MDKLLEKYPALVLSYAYLDVIKTTNLKPEMKNKLYNSFKITIDCVGLTHDEYETAIKWFCDTMDY